MIIMSDGASHEAPRFPKTLHVAIDLFQTHKLDVLLHGVNASGLSAFNPVERRMAPLSHDLVGVILPHDIHGSHLDNRGKTFDIELEKQNFFRAAEILSEIWSDTVIDGKSVDCAAVPLGQEYIPLQPDPKWIANHVQQSRYSLQVVKCDDPACCEPFVTDWRTIFPDRFVPFPAVYTSGPNGVVSVEPSTKQHPKEYEFAPLHQPLLLKKKPNEARHYNIIPFDLLFFCFVRR